MDKAGSKHPKTSHKAYRLIHHLSYGLNSVDGKGINQHIPDELCAVQYLSFDDALKLVRKAGPGCHFAKLDLDSAFSRITMNFDSFWYLVICINGQFFFDSNLPFGCFISCKLFEEVAGALEWAIVDRTGKSICHYLDDILFCEKTCPLCLDLLREFQSVCRFIGFPISEEKPSCPAKDWNSLVSLLTQKIWFCVFRRKK